MTRCSLRIAAALVVIALGHGASASAQVGKGAIVDTNTAAEKDLLALPHMTAAIVKGLMEKRPFTSVLELNAFLTSQSLTPAQLTELYGKTFIHVNLNTGTPEEILLIPGAGKRMAREFAAFRLMMNSNFVACCTGKSAGFVPLRILST